MCENTMNDLTREYYSTDSWKYLLVSSCGALASGRAQSVPEECNIRGTAGRWMTGTLPRNKRASLCRWGGMFKLVCSL